ERTFLQPSPLSCLRSVAGPDGARDERGRQPARPRVEVAVRDAPVFVDHGHAVGMDGRCTWGGGAAREPSLPRSDHAGERDRREGMFRQEGLYPVYAPLSVT